MSITKYTNIEEINQRIDNEGEFLQPEDLFVITKQGETKDTEFGNCIYDTMEVSVYDINNNLLPQKSGEKIAYIKSDDVANYIYSITNQLGKKELAINVEKLLSDIGFENGILKVNINFVRNKVGSNNVFERVWIQEISPTRQEIRILPLKTSNETINSKLKDRMANLQNQNVEFFKYKEHMINQLDANAFSIQQTIRGIVEEQFGEDIFAILQKDFGISNFNTYSNNIFTDFKQSVIHYLNNKNYHISQNNYGQTGTTIFSDCEIYEFTYINNEIKNILYECIDYNTTISVVQREFEISSLPKSFDIIEIQNQIQNTLDTINVNTFSVQNVYDPENVNYTFDDVPVVAPPAPPLLPLPTGPVSPPSPVIPGPITPTTPVSPSGGGGGGGFVSEREFKK